MTRKCKSCRRQDRLDAAKLARDLREALAYAPQHADTSMNYAQRLGYIESRAGFVAKRLEGFCTICASEFRFETEAVPA